MWTIILEQMGLVLPRDNKALLQMTHVCQAWRWIFTSQPRLWTYLTCANKEMTRTYLQRSKSCPLRVVLNIPDPWVHTASSILDPWGPSVPWDGWHNTSSTVLSSVLPDIVPRLGSLAVSGFLSDVQDIVERPCMSLPAPLLEDLSLDVRVSDVTWASWGPGAPLNPGLFNADLPRLRSLSLANIDTYLPWRKMAHLTSLRLSSTAPKDLTISHLLDFLESAPNLQTVRLHHALPTASTEDDRVVELSQLKSLKIIGKVGSSVLLNCLKIPSGAKLKISASEVGSVVEELLPTSLQNLGNTSKITAIRLVATAKATSIRCDGPSGTLDVHVTSVEAHWTRWMLDYVLALNTSGVQLLEVTTDPSVPERNPEPLSDELVLRALAGMVDLRTLGLASCEYRETFLRVLGVRHDEAAVCPRLDELVLGSAFEALPQLLATAETRVLHGAQLGTVKLREVEDWAREDATSLERLRNYVVSLVNM